MSGGVGVADEWLVERAKAGRADAFSILVRRHQGRVYRLAFRLVGDAHLAEEVAQDVFVQAWRSLSGFGGRSSVSSWLHRITVNSSLNARRSLRRVAPLPVSGRSPRADGPEQAVEDRARLAAVDRAVQALRAEHRAVFVLRDLEGYSYQEISSTMGVSVAAVRSRLHRARSEVAAAMAEWA